MAQAVHWFDIPKFLNLIKTEIVNKDGVFALLGYYCRGFEFNFPENPDFQ
jgi:hypothetical protein